MQVMMMSIMFLGIDQVISKIIILPVQSLRYDLPIGNPHPVAILQNQGLGSMSLCHHNISKNPNHDLTLLSLPTTVKCE